MKKIILSFFLLFCLSGIFAQDFDSAEPVPVPVKEVSTSALDTNKSIGVWGQLELAFPVWGLQYQMWVTPKFGFSATFGGLAFQDVGLFSFAGDAEFLILKNEWKDITGGLSFYGYTQLNFSLLISSGLVGLCPGVSGGIGVEFVFGKHFSIPLQFGFGGYYWGGALGNMLTFSPTLGSGLRCRF